MRITKIRAAFRDERGGITDILERVEIDCVTLITFKRGARRGDHYHKESVQYAYVLKGRLELLTQILEKETEVVVIEAGDLVFTPAMERHAFIALEDSEILVLTRGPRGGENFEEDTYRLAESLVPVLDKEGVACFGGVKK